MKKLIITVALLAALVTLPACHAMHTSRTDYHIVEKSVEYYDDGTTKSSTESSFNSSRKVSLAKVLKNWPVDGKSYKNVEYWESGQVKMSDEYEVDRNGHARKLIEYYETGQIKRVLQQEAAVGTADPR